MKISIQVEVAANINQVWHCWTNPDEIINWNFASDEWWCPAAEIELQAGGRFSYRMEAKDGSVGFDLDGEFIEVVPKQSILYKLEDERQVQIEFSESENGICISEVFDAETVHTPEQQKQGWQAILNNFKKHVEHKISMPAA